jgi:hypothetical protein
MCDAISSFFAGEPEPPQVTSMFDIVGHNSKDRELGVHLSYRPPDDA